MPEKFGITIPNNIPGRADDWVKSLDPIESPVFPVFSELGSPRVQDVEIPEKLKPFLDAWGKDKEQGGKAILPDGFTVAMHYGCAPIPPSMDRLGFLPIEKEYKEWFSDVWTKWWDSERENHSKFLYWAVNIQKKKEGARGESVNFHFSPQHDLVRFWSIKPSQVASASFRGKKLYRLWAEAPNETFFPDPRGPADSIWPSWVKGEKYDRESPATQADWEKYIDKVRRGERVISGKTRRYVHQTEKQANDNLKASREFIYSRSRQACYFRRTLEDPGFVSMVGYKAHSEYGFFLPKKSPSTRRLDFSETKNFLAAWSGEF